MASKIKSRAKKPPLSTVDKLIYYFIYLMAFILLLSYLYFISFIAEKVAYSDVDIIAFNNGFIYLSSLPLILLLTCSAVVIAIAPGVITSLFTKDAELINVCVPIIYTLCFFQVFDGIQATLAGIFRGLKHTEVIMMANFIAFWLVAIPLGCLLALHFKLNLIGFWYALIVSTIILCTIVLVNLIKRFKEMDTQG